MATHWDKLTSDYKEKGLVLFLGAGVSLDSGVPPWSDLICRLMESFPQTGGRGAFNSLRQAGFSLPTITEFIKRTVNDESLFVSTLRTCLYRDFRFNGAKIDSITARRFVADTDDNNRTLRAVYDLAVLDKQEGLAANPRIYALVNFNLDNLIEAYDRARHLVKGIPGTRSTHTIESASHNRIFGRVSVYHPHGFLRFDSYTGVPSELSELIVLSEYEFFDFYNRSTEIFTYTILSLLREYHCLFVGMSLTDDNIRRLLFYSTTERERARQRNGRSIEGPRHYAVMPRPSQVEHLNLLEVTLTALGVRPMWVDDVSEIPLRLSELAYV